MIQAIIIDHESESRQELTVLLGTHCPNVEIVGRGRDLEDAKKLIRKYQPKLVFLEVELPHESGFKLLESPEIGETETILLSSSAKYARRAFKTTALHYLLKPIQVRDIKEAVNRVQQKLEERYFSLLSVEYKKTPKRSIPKRIRLPMVDGFLFAQTADISHFVAAGRKYIAHFKNGTSVEINCRFGDCVKQFSVMPFTQVHRSIIVNMHFVKEYKKGQENSLVLSGGEQIPVGKNYRNNVQDALTHLGLLPS